MKGTQETKSSTNKASITPVDHDQLRYAHDDSDPGSCVPPRQTPSTPIPSDLPIDERYVAENLRSLP